MVAGKLTLKEVRRMRQKKGQSILEYALLITAVVIAVVYGANNIIRNRAQETMDTAGDVINHAGNELRSGMGL